MRLRSPILLILTLLLLPGCARKADVRPAASAEALFAAARAGDVGEVQRLLDAGLEVDVEDRYGATALLMAAGNGRAETVRLLLDRGADPDHTESFYGANAIGMAMFRRQPGIIEMLVRAGADDRELALELAVRDGRVELARAAVESGPILESRLAALRDRSDELDPELRALLDRAETRPDPPPPVLDAGDLARYTGSFEGQTSDLRVRAAVAGEELTLSIDGGEPVTVEPVAEDAFTSTDGSVAAFFYGRAGTIEGLNLRRGEGPPESLRHSVAEPAGPSAFRPPPEASSGTGETVHWPGFRGANASGIGDGAGLPVEIDVEEGKNVLWQARVPGLGNSSPVVWGNRVFLTTASADGVEQGIRTGLTGAGDSIDEDVVHRWRVLAYEKWSGDLLWDTEVGRGRPLTKRHFKATQANSTPVTDGEHLVVVFPTAGLACLDLEGNLQWRHELGGLNTGAFTDPGVEWGFASSPVLYGSLAVLQADTHDGAYLAAWDLETGEQVWRVERDVAPSWATPTLLRGREGDELVVNGSTIHAYDPATGRELWSLGPNSELVIATPVARDQVVYVSAGYPPVKPIYAVPAGTRGPLEVDPAGGDGRLVWSHGRGGAYMPTPLLYRGLLYVVHHNGRLVAYDAASGTAIYKRRFSRGGVFTGSPVAANGRLYLPTEEGLLYVLEAGPEDRELAVNDLGEPLMATPAISEGVLLVRTPSRLIAASTRSPEAASR